MTHKPYEILEVERPSRWLVTCDHAANTIPQAIGGGCLGLPLADMARHIAYDVGAAGVTRTLSALLNGPAILSNFSRLVIDPNRGEDDPTLLMKLYDGTIIPANRNADEAEVTRRLTAYHRPYHDALTEVAARRNDTVILSVHSFTPQLRGRAPRPWQIGVLYGRDDRLARMVLAHLAREPDLCIGDNEPYSGHLPGDAMDRHAVGPGRPHVLIELRNDLIADPDGQAHWANRLAPILDAALSASHL